MSPNMHLKYPLRKTFVTITTPNKNFIVKNEKG